MGVSLGEAISGSCCFAVVALAACVLEWESTCVGVFVSDVSGRKLVSLRNPEIAKCHCECFLRVNEKRFCNEMGWKFSHGQVHLFVMIHYNVCVCSIDTKFSMFVCLFVCFLV